MDEIASHIWQSTIVGAAAAVLALMFRNNSAQVRYWIWFAAAMKFLVPLSAISAVASRIPLPSPRPGAGEALETAAIVFRSSAPSLSEAESAFVIGIWLAGAFTVMLAWWWQWRRLAAAARLSRPMTDGFVHDTLRRVERAAGVRKPTLIVTSSLSLEPGVLGIRKPLLMWPRHLTERLGPTHIEAIVTHEVCHIVRRDNLLASAHLVVSAVFWFHPLVWWIGARLVDERERACDEYVLDVFGEPHEYAQGILNVCKLYVESPIACVSGVSGSNLKKRIEAIMINRIGRNLNPLRKTGLAVVAAAAVAAPFFAGMITAPVRASFQGQSSGDSSQAGAGKQRFEVASVKPCQNEPAAPTGARSGGPGLSNASPG